MSKRTPKGDTVVKYLTIFPKAGALTLAKKIVAENENLFDSVEQARDLIRIYTGNHGDRQRKKNFAGKKLYRPNGISNSYNLPESYKDKWEPVKLRPEENDILVMSDIHIPYHDVEAVNAVISYAKEWGINTILLNGDILDMYALSRFVNDPRKRNLNDEIWDLVEFLEVLNKEFNNPKIYYKIGNHEERLESYLRVKAPQLLDMEEFQMKDILKIRGVDNVEIVTGQIIYAGRLPIVHGHEFQSKATGQVNPARTLFLKTLNSGMVSHHHITSSHTERDINGKIMSTFSVACLCGLHPEYARINKWNHGFARIRTEGQEFKVNNHKIHNGKVYTE
jgi:predicted phosphodiesterase